MGCDRPAVCRAGCATEQTGRAEARYDKKAYFAAAGCVALIPHCAMHTLTIPTEPVGSIPRPLQLIEAVRAHDRGEIDRAALDAQYDDAIADTLKRFEATGSPVISDGEQRKYHNFATYCVHGAPNLAPDGFKLQFVDHFRQWPRLTAGPFRYLFGA